ncbi:MAG TPA: RsmE family RNA methyltransferase, partial [Ilumatobacteraceae bacterium]|nr:RsmE family RNA methyltransferase [Ilumatobacteraceae bacterium]
MDEVLRRSAAHVLVADVAAPAADDAAAHHLRRVLRLRDGEVVTVTDGAGRWRACRVAGDTLDVDGAVVEIPAPAAPLTLAVAPPKGERLEWLVQKCTEIGVDRIVLLA